MSYSIPLFDLNYDTEEEEAVLKTIRSKWISMGEQTKELESEFRKLLDDQVHCIAVSSCTSALHIALSALGVGSGDEVIVPSLTFVATANAVKYVGAEPVFADISSAEDLSIDPDEIETKITPRTKAILVMHYGGFACNMEAICAIAQKHGLLLVEDAAHAPGSTFQDKKIGTFGDASCFSFFSNKNISCGEGGLVAFKSEVHAQKAKLLRSHGMTTLSFERARGHATSYDVIETGYNYRLDDIRASLVLSQLKKLPGDTARRAAHRKRYNELLAAHEAITIPYLNHPHESAQYIYPIVLKESDFQQREAVRTKLAEDGIQTSVHYPAAHRFKTFESDKNVLPKTEYASDNEITLPLYGSLKEEDIDRICDSLIKAIDLCLKNKKSYLSAASMR